MYFFFSTLVRSYSLSLFPTIYRYLFEVLPSSRTFHSFLFRFETQPIVYMTRCVFRLFIYVCFFVIL